LGVIIELVNKGYENVFIKENFQKLLTNIKKNVIIRYKDKREGNFLKKDKVLKMIKYVVVNKNNKEVAMFNTLERAIAHKNNMKVVACVDYRIVHKEVEIYNAPKSISVKGGVVSFNY